MNKHGGNTFEHKYIKHDFSVNLSPLGMPEEVKLALAESIDTWEDYTDVNQGELRRALGEYYGVDSRVVVCGNGAADLIYRIPLAIKRLGGFRQGHILEPAFSEYQSALEEADFGVLHHLTANIDPSEGDVVFICNPGNPTGRLIPKEEVMELAQLCSRRKAYLIVDECFLELTEAGDDVSVIGSLAGLPTTIVLRSFTKTYAMAGLRLGYAICGSAEISEALLDTGQPWSVSKPGEVAALAALKAHDYRSKVREYLREERVAMFDALKSLGLQVMEPGANYIFFHGPTGLDLALMEEGFLIRNCSNYYGLGEGSYRVAIRRREENRLLIQAIEDVLML